MEAWRCVFMDFAVLCIGARRLSHAIPGYTKMYVFGVVCAFLARRGKRSMLRIRMWQAWDLPTLPAGGTAGQQVHEDASQPTRAEKPSSPSSIVLLSLSPLASAFIQSCIMPTTKYWVPVTINAATHHACASLGRGPVLLHQLNQRMLLLDSSLARLGSFSPK